MPKFSANLSMLFTELPFLERFAAAADAGFTAVEFMFPYAHDVDDIAHELQRHRLRLVLFNLPPGNWDTGDRGNAIFPDCLAQFRSGVALAARYATSLECSQLHCLAGIVPADGDARTYTATYIDNLRYAADAFDKHGIALLIEPINTRDIPGYYLTSSAQARDVMARVDRRNLRLQYDLYHMHIMGEDAPAELTRHRDAIAHVQLADAPGRHEPGTGEIDFARLLGHLDNIGFGGYVGLEYRPSTATVDSLAWLQALSR
ncbi:MAG: hydroxypyruvate isomerase [Hyphomicrobium sp.]|nr:hydroxypyruvate isomerase [Hyphomicrobium sp.]